MFTGRAERISVAEIDGLVVGYAYGGAHRAREAYNYSVETSAYVHGDHHRKGIARKLYLELFEQLTRLGYANAYAWVTLPNDASYGFHQSLGFEPIGNEAAGFDDEDEALGMLLPGGGREAGKHRTQCHASGSESEAFEEGSSVVHHLVRVLR